MRRQTKYCKETLTGGIYCINLYKINPDLKDFQIIVNFQIKINKFQREINKHWKRNTKQCYFIIKIVNSLNII